MAYPLSAAQIAQVYEILRIPQSGAGLNIPIVASFWGPHYEIYDFASLITAINARITALSSEQCTRITTHLDRWDVIGGTNPLQIEKSSSGSEGEIVNYPKEREEIRQALGFLIGLIVPKGGFLPYEKSSGGVVSR